MSCFFLFASLSSPPFSYHYLYLKYFTFFFIIIIFFFMFIFLFFFFDFPFYIKFCSLIVRRGQLAPVKHRVFGASNSPVKIFALSLLLKIKYLYILCSHRTRVLSLTWIPSFYMNQSSRRDALLPSSQCNSTLIHSVQHRSSVVTPLLNFYTALFINHQIKL